MVEISLFDKIKLLFDLIVSSPLFLILIFGFALMAVDIFVISKKSKLTKIMYLVISIIIIILLLNQYLDSFGRVLDTIAKNIVTIIYFPSVLEYIVILLVSLIILLVSSISKNTNPKIKIINLVVFAINIFIFFLILDQLSVLKVDLTNKVSIYSNEVLMSLFELSIALFSIWIIGLVLYKIIHKLTYKEEIKENFYDEPEMPKTIEELRKEELKIPPQIEYIVVEKKNDNDMFTLAEYRELKKFLEIMKAKQNKEE